MIVIYLFLFSLVLTSAYIVYKSIRFDRRQNELSRRIDELKSEAKQFYDDMGEVFDEGDINTFDFGDN